MKILSILLISLSMIKGCNSNDLKDTTITYVASTRGFYQKITIQNQEVSINKTRGDESLGETRKISDSDWKTLVALFSKIDLDKLNTYEGPTKRRQFDGAAFGSIAIHYQDKDYENAAFDHGNPPVEIKEFVDKIVSFSNQNEE